MGGRVEVWKECAQWLTRCGVLREDHKVNWPESVASDLAMTLRDGVLLCFLLIKIEPLCIDSKDINQRPSMARFLCLRNINSFLQACKESFGLKGGDLFEAQCLFDLDDFLKVLETLSKLSQSHKFIQRNIRGFYLQKGRSSSQEDIYRNISQSEGAAFVNAAVEPDDYDSHHGHTRSEEIYQDLCSIARINQQLPSAQPVSLVEKRDYVISELVETERKYIDVLNGLQKQFMKPLAHILTDEDYKIIFFGITELFDIHTAFLVEMRRAVTPGSTHRLSDVFLTCREKFLIYGDFIANLTSAKNKIADLYLKDAAFQAELMRCEDKGQGKFKLRDILTVPMQRILKYHLLLDRLVSETQMNFDDFRGLERAKESMVDIAQYLNEVNRDSEALVITMKSQRTIIDWPPGTDLHEFGRYILDGELRIKAHNDKTIKLRNVFIFDTAIVITKAVKGDFAYKYCLNLTEYRQQDIENCKKVTTLTREARWHQWLLVHKAEQTAYTCYSRCEKFKSKCMKAIAEAIDNIDPDGQLSNHHRFRLHTFCSPTTCTHCSKYLKGKIFQGYVCDICRVTCHKMCLTYCGRCGSVSHPPMLPPRLPARTTTPLPPPPLSPALVEELQRFMWYVGEMSRERAASLLENRMTGTYLLRVRPQGKANPSESVFSLSLKTDDRVKHMKIYEKEIDGTMTYNLSVHRFFKSVIELVTYYEKNCLGENFQNITATLQWPFRQLVVVAEFDYHPTEPNQLPLCRGCQLIVLSKEGDSKGWWRGTNQNREGFFPKNYVREISDTLTLGIHEL